MKLCPNSFCASAAKNYRRQRHYVCGCVYVCCPSVNIYHSLDAISLLSGGISTNSSCEWALPKSFNVRSQRSRSYRGEMQCSGRGITIKLRSSVGCATGGGLPVWGRGSLSFVNHFKSYTVVTPNVVISLLLTSCLTITTMSALP